MKALKTLLFLVSLLCVRSIQAQSVGLGNTNTVIQYLDRFEHAFNDRDWNVYLSLCHPGIVSYYGGKNEYLEHLERNRSAHDAIADTHFEVIQIEHLETQVQCVVCSKRNTVIDGTKAQVISYLLGVSKDGGTSWEFVDIDKNSPENVVYIVPDVFESISIPQRQIIFEKAQLLTRD